MKLEPGKLYRNRYNDSYCCFVLISLGKLAGHDSLDQPYVTGCMVFNSRGIVESVSLWCADLEEL